MENALAKLGNATTPISRSELDERFLRAFEDTFSGKEFSLKITGTANDPWFRAKDVLKGMGYSTTKEQISKIDADLRKPLQDFIGLSRYNRDNPEIGYHEGKEIYVNEPGLYQLIMLSRLKSAKSFKDFLFEYFTKRFKRRVHHINHGKRTRQTRKRDDPDIEKRTRRGIPEGF